MKRIWHDNWPTILCAAGVFVLAILVRLPSSYESLWIDELHTAWCIWGDLGQVAERAEAGNQTPIYFQLMWLWRAVVGDAEVGLRMSSILAVSLASAFLVLGLRQTTKQLPMGLFAGSVLALEINSIFFGTEFRPYAFIILMSVITVWCGQRLLMGDAKVPRPTLRLIMMAATGFAAIIHPTSLATLGIYVGLVSFICTLNHGVPRKVGIADMVSFVLVVATGLALANSSLTNSWENRQFWRAFGAASSWKEFWPKSWDWWPMCFIPLGLLISTLIARRAAKRDTEWKRAATGIVPLIAGSAATLLFFVASYCEYVPLWQRRYFVAALPMLAWSMGECFHLPMDFVHCSIRKAVFGTLAGATVVFAMLYNQGQIDAWSKGQIQLVGRGEGWREAVSYVNGKLQVTDSVFLESGLIEMNRFAEMVDIDNMPSHQELEYLKFPLSGPYMLSHNSGFELTSWDLHPSRSFAGPVNVNVTDAAGKPSRHMSRRRWIICRSPWQGSMNPKSYPNQVRFRSFGKLTVVLADYPEGVQPIMGLPESDQEANSASETQ